MRGTLFEAVYCIHAQKENGTYRGARVGRLTKDAVGNFGLTCNHYAGQVVLFVKEMSPSDSQLQMGEYRGMKQSPTGKVTIEIPLTPREIAQNKKARNLVTTIGTMINVPRGHVREIKRVSITSL